ncbi:hypothetical protein J1N35_028357 [Gossypium stocksii]|uniref:Uncharacterized protein n=1 Tax=Gossypium stocksii TaxID=47602 RepID=A0A9D3ZSK1_9ROSI|nr:hypothetical protein J1N35_028357 [Gossypium stocksii]
MVEMHEFGQVMQQFGFRQTIPPSPKTSKHCTRSTCEEESMKIYLNSMGIISTLGSTSTISYLVANHFSLRNWRPLWTTCHGSDITASHIFCQKRQRLGNIILGDQEDPHINPRSRVYALTESSSAPTQHEAPRAIPPLR